MMYDSYNVLSKLFSFITKSGNIYEMIAVKVKTYTTIPRQQKMSK